MVQYQYENETYLDALLVIEHLHVSLHSLSLCFLGGFGFLGGCFAAITD